jgi:hypothetical protein
MTGMRLIESRVLGALAVSRMFGAVFGVTVLCVLSGLVCTIPVAYGEPLTPWWNLTVSGRPAYVQPGTAKDEIQEIAVTAKEGFFYLVEVNGEGIVNVSKLTLLPYNASAEQVEKQLRAEVYPGRSLSVSGGATATGSKYTVTFPGQRVLPMRILAFAGAEGSVGEKQKGSPDGEIVLSAENLGDANANSKISPVMIADRLPAGLEAKGIEGIGNTYHGAYAQAPVVECAIVSLSCTLAGSVAPYATLEVRISVVARPGALSGEVGEASVSGGGAATGTVVKRPVGVGGQAPFGIEDYGMVAEEAGGAPDRQAGSHPFQLTTTLDLNQTAEAMPAGAMTKDLRFDLPPGLVGNPVPFQQCTDAQFAKPVQGNANECPPQTAVGVATITFNEPQIVGLVTSYFPIFNMVPRGGEPARFGFSVLGVPVFLDASVRTGGDYGVTINVNNITEIAGFLSNRVTFWGVPGDPRHDAQRGWGCLYEIQGLPCKSLEALKPAPLLSLPTSCTGVLRTTVEADSWVEPGVFLAPFAPNEAMVGLDGCNRLPFDPSIEVKPDVPNGSSSTGLTVDVHVPQEEILSANGLSPSEVRTTVVTLPAGVAVNPAAGDGLSSCSEAQVALASDTPALCPDTSKVGTVEVKSPLLPNTLVGSAYLAAQNQNPFGSLVALYLIFEDPVSGTLIKVAGEVKPDPVTGQLVSTFPNTPQLPFEDLVLHFFGGSRAPLGTPALCGSYTTTTSLQPWSGNPAAEPSSRFDITSGPNGGPCSDPLPFKPELTAGTTSIQAGGFSPFTMTMSREDGNQPLQAIKLKMPPGLSGLLSGVKLCGEPQADRGLCGPESLIGETIVSVGLGGSPFSVKGGKVYITEGYGGAPYGLSIVNPAKAGPFDLEKSTACDCVVVRAKIEVDPITAALTITSDNTGPYKIPTILDGIPLQIKHVNVLINRPGFTFNPTNCNPMQITGSLSSTEGAASALSVPLQVTNCAVLGFKPAFSVSTAGKTSRANGASLHVRLVYPKAPFGSQANIAKVKVDLPKQLPSRLTTLQKACPDSTFNQNPAACGPESRIGEAKATTPLLPVALTGPVYFVSHAGLKFPELVIVLSGYGTTIQLHAETFISKAGITSSTFRTVPDAPVGTFELTLPQGKFSALAAPGNLCKASLKMPTAFTAQNGATIKQSTPITVTGCAKKKTKAHKAHKASHHRKGSAHGKKK